MQKLMLWHKSVIVTRTSQLKNCSTFHIQIRGLPVPTKIGIPRIIMNPQYQKQNDYYVRSFRDDFCSVINLFQLFPFDNCFPAIAGHGDNMSQRYETNNSFILGFLLNLCFFEPTWPYYLTFNLSKTTYFLKRA